jgi:hypothetical protein
LGDPGISCKPAALALLIVAVDRKIEAESNLRAKPVWVLIDFIIHLVLYLFGI